MLSRPNGELRDGHTAHHPAHYTHDSGGPAAAPLLWPSACVSDDVGRAFRL